MKHTLSKKNKRPERVWVEFSKTFGNIMGASEIKRTVGYCGPTLRYKLDRGNEVAKVLNVLYSRFLFTSAHCSRVCPELRKAGFKVQFRGGRFV